MGCSCWSVIKITLISLLLGTITDIALVVNSTVIVELVVKIIPVTDLLVIKFCIVNPLLNALDQGFVVKI